MIKKFLAVSASAVMMLAMSVSAFAAGSINADEQKILDELKAKNVPAEYITQAENYFKGDSVDIKASEATDIISHIDTAAAEAKAAGIKSVDELKKNETVFNKVIAEAQAAGKVIGLTVTADVKAGTVTIKDSTGKTVFSQTAGTTKTTGADSTATVAVVSVLGLAVATLAVATKKNAEA